MALTATAINSVEYVIMKCQQHVQFHYSGYRQWLMVLINHLHIRSLQYKYRYNKYNAARLCFLSVQ